MADILRAAGGFPREEILLDTSQPLPLRRPAPRSKAEAIQEAVRGIVEDHQRAQDKLAPFLPIYRINDYLRHERDDVAEGRRLCSAAGDCEQTWDVLALIADRERRAHCLEAEADAIVPAYYVKDDGQLYDDRT